MTSFDKLQSELQPLKNIIASLNQICTEINNPELKIPAEVKPLFNKWCSQLSIATLNIENPEFLILLLGERRNGKSTLINAILGEEVMPSSDEVVTTNVIIRLGYRKDNPKSLRVQLRNDLSEEEYKALHLRFPTEGFLTLRHSTDIEQYASAFDSSDQLELLSKFSMVSISWPSEILKKGVVFIDTPGWNQSDYIYHQIVTNLIPQADAYIFVMDATKGGLSNQEKLQLDTIMEHYKNNLFMVLNKMDLRDDKTVEEFKKKVRMDVDLRNIDKILEICNSKNFVPTSAKDSLLKKDNKWTRNFKQMEENLIQYLTGEPLRRKKEENASFLEKIAQEMLATCDLLLSTSKQEEMQKICKQFQELTQECLKKIKNCIQENTELLRRETESSYDAFYFGLLGVQPNPSNVISKFYQFLDKYSSNSPDNNPYMEKVYAIQNCVNEQIKKLEYPYSQLRERFGDVFEMPDMTIPYDYNDFQLILTPPVIPEELVVPSPYNQKPFATTINPSYCETTAYVGVSTNPLRASDEREQIKNLFDRIVEDNRIKVVSEVANDFSIRMNSWFYEKQKDLNDKVQLVETISNRILKKQTDEKLLEFLRNTKNHLLNVIEGLKENENKRDRKHDIEQEEEERKKVKV